MIEPLSARVEGVEPLGGLSLVRVALDPRTALGEPGQFHMVLGGDYLPRPIGLIRLGDGVGFVVGDPDGMAGPELQVLGPLGRGFDLSRVDPELTLLVGAGFGLTTMPEIGRRHPGLRLIAGIRQADHAALIDLVPGVTCIATCIAPDLVTAPLEAALGDVDLVLAAGPAPMGRAVAEICARHGVPSQIALEAPMACGFGACFGCAVELDRTWQRCCVEGPVVDGARLVA